MPIPDGHSSVTRAWVLVYSVIKRRPRRAFLCAAVGISIVAFWKCLPDPLFSVPYSPIIVDRNGALLSAKVAPDGQWRFPAGLTVPEKFSQALIRAEDKRFYTHPGIDLLALVRAMRLNISSGRVVSGASTISMQVVRLSRGSKKRTYVEKFVEMILALRLELASSKNSVLTLYSTHAPFGGNVVGLEAASWRYFGRDPDSMSWAEASVLAVLPNRPSLIHPGRNRDLLRFKRDRLLRQLHIDNVIDDIDLEVALSEPLPARPLPLPRSAPHLMGTLVAGSKGGDRRFETTLNGQLQRSVQEIVRRHSERLSAQGIHNAAVLVADNETFEVLAYIGNSKWSTSSGQGYAVDIVQRPRSTGSTLKPLLYAVMLQSGEILPTTLVPDLPTRFAGYFPENFDRGYRGAVPARYALARSLNVPSVRMLNLYGVPRFYAALKRFGMKTLHRPPQDYGLTLILGGAEGTLWDLSTIYANVADIAQRGALGSAEKYRKLTLLLSGNTSTPRIREIGPGAAWLTLDALQEVNRPDTDSFWRQFSSSQRIAWKTGTSYGQRDGWSIGSTAKYTVGVWVGNATGEGKADLTGVASAAPIMFDVFSHLGPSPWFSKPEADLREIDVCLDDGYLPADGCKTERLSVPVHSQFDRASPYHRVVHLDASGTFRVHGKCERVSKMSHQSWFELPPGQEFYYRRKHPEYRPLPPYRADCLANLLAVEIRNPIDLLYPHRGSRIYIPVELGAKKGRTVFEAVHRSPDETLYWHLDDQFIGKTTSFHQRALDIEPGTHVITIVDSRGNRLSRRFEVLANTRRKIAFGR